MDDEYESLLLLLELWRSEGVDTSGVEQDASAPTGIYFVTHSAEGHHFHYYRAGSAASRMTPQDLVLRDTAAPDHWLRWIGNRVLFLGADQPKVPDRAREKAVVQRADEKRTTFLAVITLTVTNASGAVVASNNDWVSADIATTSSPTATSGWWRRRTI